VIIRNAGGEMVAISRNSFQGVFAFFWYRFAVADRRWCVYCFSFFKTRLVSVMIMQIMSEPIVFGSGRGRLGGNCVKFAFFFFLIRGRSYLSWSRLALSLSPL